LKVRSPKRITLESRCFYFSWCRCELRAGRFRIDFALPADSALVIAETKFAIAAERNEIAGRIKQLQPEVSNRQIAKTLGVNHDAELIAARQLFAIE